MVAGVVQVCVPGNSRQAFSKPLHDSVFSCLPMIPASSFILYPCHIKYTSLIVIQANTQIKKGEFVFVSSRQLIKQAAAHPFLSKQNLWKGRGTLVARQGGHCLFLAPAGLRVWSHWEREPQTWHGDYYNECFDLICPCELQASSSLLKISVILSIQVLARHCE